MFDLGGKTLTRKEIIEIKLALSSIQESLDCVLVALDSHDRNAVRIEKVIEAWTELMPIEPEYFQDYSVATEDMVHFYQKMEKALK